MKPQINPHARFLDDQKQPVHGPLLSAGYVDEFGHASPVGEQLTDPEYYAMLEKVNKEVGANVHGTSPRYAMVDPESVGLPAGTQCGIPEEYVQAGQEIDCGFEA